MRKPLAVASLYVVVFVAGCGSSGGGKADAAAAPIDAPVAMADSPYYLPNGTTLTPFLSPDAQHMFTMAGQATEPNKDYFAVIETDVGRIVIDLYEDKTPITVNSFVWLALHHFFDGQAFHRVVDAFVAQGGDPNSISGPPSTWGTGGPGYMFGLEIDATLSYDKAGVVGMAREMAPDTNGSQFFITLSPATFLDGQYTIFGGLTEGLDVLPNIVRGEPPATPTRMTSVYIVEKAK